MQKGIRTLLCILLFVLLWTEPAASATQRQGSPEEALIGSWHCQGPGGMVPLVFESGSRLAFDGEAFTYKLVPNIIRVREGKKAVDYHYTLKGSKLQITYPDGSRMICQKASQVQAGSAEKGSVGAAATGGGQAGKGLEWQLKGMLCSWGGSSSSGSSYGRSTRVSFDGKGNFRYASESSFGSGAGIAYGQRSGPANTGRYRVTGDKIHFTFGDGSSGTAQVNMRQSNGMITELMYSGQLYASGLCN